MIRSKILKMNKLSKNNKTASEFNKLNLAVSLIFVERERERESYTLQYNNLRPLVSYKTQLQNTRKACSPKKGTSLPIFYLSHLSYPSYLFHKDLTDIIVLTK